MSNPIIGFCYRCRTNKGFHHPTCRDRGDFPGQEKEYDRGWDAGRSGKVRPEESGSAYLAGFSVGIVALEEAENGFDPKFMEQ